MLQDLLPQAERIAAQLKARNETISVAESSTAGLLSAALLAIPGASAYFIGGGVVYTRQSRAELLGVTEQELTGITPSTEPYALLFARKIRGKLATTWSLGETGTAGPTGSRYGHAAGHSCIAVIGPNGERSMTVERLARPTASTTCAPFRSPHSTCWTKHSAKQSAKKPASGD
jgi:nicotinamide-nucleotide amidase